MLNNKLCLLLGATTQAIWDPANYTFGSLVIYTNVCMRRICHFKEMLYVGGHDLDLIYAIRESNYDPIFRCLIDL